MGRGQTEQATKQGRTFRRGYAFNTIREDVGTGIANIPTNVAFATEITMEPTHALRS